MMKDRPSFPPIRLMRRIDQFVGTPLCFALGLLKSIKERLSARGRGEPPRQITKVLVIKFWGMGSIVLTTPALRALKRAYPNSRVTFLTFEQNESVCRMIQWIDHVYPYRADHLLAFLASFFDLVRFMRRERFDVVIDLEFFANFTSIITALSAAPVTVGFHTPKFWRERFYTERASFDHSRHITEIFLKAPQALGAPADGYHLDALAVEEEATGASLQRILSERGVAATDQLISININSSPLDYKRRWPLDSYRELIGRILAHHRGVKILLIGSKEEALYVAELLRFLPASPDLVNLCGLIGPQQLVLLLQRSQLFIGNDSGPLHLAAAAGTPTVSFFGPETPALYGPRGGAHTVLYKNIACSPCLNVYHSKDNSSCRNNVCMKSIGVEEAWVAVSQKLKDALEVWRPSAVGGSV
jgi:ADP-heptose:LPS heptosyltransferase